MSTQLLWGKRASDWAEIQEATCRPVYLAVFDRLGVHPGSALFDAGCGAGMAAQIAAERGAVVTGLDASSDLLAIARKRVPAGDFHLGELERLPFPDDKFDLVTGFNSFQYAGNPGVALSEAQRVAKPQATIAVITWGQPEGMEAAALVAALKPLLPPAPAGAPGPFALSEEAALRAFAAEGGLETVEIFDVNSPWHYDTLAAALRGLMSSGVAARAAAASGEEAVNAAHRKALEPFRQADDSFKIQATFRCLIARA